MTLELTDTRVVKQQTLVYTLLKLANPSLTLTIDDLVIGLPIAHTPTSDIPYNTKVVIEGNTSNGFTGSIDFYYNRVSINWLLNKCGNLGNIDSPIFLIGNKVTLPSKLLNQLADNKRRVATHQTLYTKIGKTEVVEWLVDFTNNYVFTPIRDVKVFSTDTSNVGINWLYSPSLFNCMLGDLPDLEAVIDNEHLKGFGYTGKAIAELIDASRLKGYTINNNVVSITSKLDRATLGNLVLAKELEAINIASLIASNNLKGYRAILEVFRENNP